MASPLNEVWSGKSELAYPPEAYAYEADVTAEAVAEMRAMAREEIDAEEWVLIDGFGQVVRT